MKQNVQPLSWKQFHDAEGGDQLLGKRHEQASADHSDLQSTATRLGFSYAEVVELQRLYGHMNLEKSTERGAPEPPV